ncbi:MAG: Stp1/IreP family PP2C-type Ser/Thr phosphatase [Gammaproteobacteria bacterium]|nr:Stp1/IreP family PP2C-type Ser/Thr phosphatase [Pseudomonadales bacterium]MCP5346561.1 Stp1/IreP family PP2C-type Ser/Thr phosphatase [Pseudomonadales bacterium]
MSRPSTTLEITGFTDTGLARDHNEDCIGYDISSGIAVLADGMGGHQAGEIASRMAVEQVLRQMKARLISESGRPITSSQMLNMVSHTILNSNRKIFEASEEISSRHGMGTTVVAAVLEGSHLYAGHVGDSRLYLYRGGSLRRITRDHSLVQDLIDKGFYTEDEARLASINHVVTRALGTAEDVEVDILQQEAEQDDLFLLCSDGLSDMLSDAMIEQLLGETDMTLDDKAQSLVARANQNGGKDNVSVILLKVQAPE